MRFQCCNHLGVSVFWIFRVWKIELLVESKNHTIHGTGIFGCFQKMVGFPPAIIHFKRAFHYKPSILGDFPLLLETSIYTYAYLWGPDCWWKSLTSVRLAAWNPPPTSGRFKSYRSGGSRISLRARSILITFIIFDNSSCIILAVVRSTLLLLSFHLHSLFFRSYLVSLQYFDHFYHIRQ